jgi:amino acid transporter
MHHVRHIASASSFTPATDTKVVLTLAALMFLCALLLGVWKYREIATTDAHAAHLYVDIAHRAALRHSFALLLVATFVELSGFGELVNLLAACAMASYFFMSVAGYALRGYRKDTDNQFRDPQRGLHAYMLALIVFEIGGWLVLVAGFADKQLF